MSLQVFKSDLIKSGMVDQDRLKAIWEHHNLQSKSPLIDPMTKFLNKQIEDRGGSIDPKLAERLCNHYHNVFIRKMIKPVTPVIEDTMIDGKAYRWNPSTGIVFDDDIAVGVLAEGQVHDLRLKHLCICVSKGWKFKTDEEGYDSPFKV